MRPPRRPHYAIKMKSQNLKTKEYGFTLIELLVVVVIISVLSGLVLSVINTGGIRSKARDSQRASDLKKIQTALELYYAENRQYPTSGSNQGWVKVSSFLPSYLEPDFIDPLPLDPADEEGSAANQPCSSPDIQRYHYITNASGSVYMLAAIMEVATSNDDNECSSLNGYGSIPSSTCSSFATSDVCYGVENP